MLFQPGRGLLCTCSLGACLVQNQSSASQNGQQCTPPPTHSICWSNQLKPTGCWPDWLESHLCMCMKPPSTHPAKKQPGAQMHDSALGHSSHTGQKGRQEPSRMQNPAHQSSNALPSYCSKTESPAKQACRQCTGLHACLFSTHCSDHTYTTPLPLLPCTHPSRYPRRSSVPGPTQNKPSTGAGHCTCSTRSVHISLSHTKHPEKGCKSV
jgi:hypothetical protein